MQVAAANHQRTILDYLNQDCWRAVLDYVPVVDIIKSECVSRQWQRVVLTYLSHARISVLKDWFSYGKRHRTVAMSRLPCGPSFESWTKKLGPSLVACHCEDDPEDSLYAVSENCPNLEELMCLTLGMLPEPLNDKECFHQLQKLCFYYSSVTDSCVSQLLASNDLEELKILDNNYVTGEFLTHLKSTKLKVLVFKRCLTLQFTPLLSVATRLGGLTKLVLKRVPEETGWSAHLLLDKMPRLEYLFVTFHFRFDPDKNIHNNRFFELVCQLSNLEYLCASYSATDRHIEAVMGGCRKLRTLHVSGQWCTERGMAALCGAGARVTELTLPTSSHDQVEACVRACPNLTSLRIGAFLTQRLGRRVIAARRALSPPPPRLTIHISENYDSRLHSDLEENKDILYVPPRDDQYDSDWVDEYSS